MSTRTVITRLALLATVVAGGGSSCRPESEVFGGTITGTVFDLSAAPVGYVTVYVVDGDGAKEGDVDALSGVSGRFRLEAPAGTWTLVATDFAGTASFLYEVRVSNGSVTDVGSLYLAPCAEPGSGTNSEVYEECPDPSADDYGYGVPTENYTLDTFEPVFTDVNISDAPVSDDVLQITSENADVRIDIMIPSDSPYFAVGEHVISYEYDYFFATLFEFETSVIYVLREGIFSIEAFDAVEGGQFRARLSSAVFEWYDYESQIPDASFVATVDATAPAMTDIISVTPTNEDPGAPPANSHVFAQIEPEFTQVYLDADGSASVVTYDLLPTGEYLELYLEIPPELNAVGSFPVQNTFGGSGPGDWDIQFLASALYTDELGGQYGYILEHGTWIVTDAAGGDGDSFSATLQDAVFQWQSDPGATPYSSLTLEIEDSGTISGFADVQGSDDGGGGHNWLDLKPDLTSQLGN